jgi:hypothetical protein
LIGVPELLDLGRYRLNPRIELAPVAFPLSRGDGERGRTIPLADGGAIRLNLVEAAAERSKLAPGISMPK